MGPWRRRHLFCRLKDVSGTGDNRKKFPSSKWKQWGKVFFSFFLSVFLSFFLSVFGKARFSSNLIRGET
jgi:hypothetical protein